MCEVIDVLGLQLWIKILLQLRHAENVIRKIIVKDVMSFLSTCTNTWQYRNNDVLWCYICSDFSDFKHMQRTIADVSWRDLYLQRLTHLHKTHELAIGDPPEYNITIHIYGDGRCYISRNDVQEPLTEYRTPGHMGTGIIGEKEIIDVHSANNTILFLCQDGKVLEIMFMPSWVNDYEEYRRPMLIEFPDLNGEYIRMIRVLPTTNFAVSNKGKIFVWTLFEHPETMEKIHTRPVYLHQLADVVSETDVYDIQSIQSPGMEKGITSTRIYYRKVSGKDRISGSLMYGDAYIDVSDVQIYTIIVDNYFSEEEMIRLTELINHAN
jgi:hypothetical protein